MRGFTGAILIISGVSLLGFGNLADAAGPTQADFDLCNREAHAQATSPSTTSAGGDTPAKPGTPVSPSAAPAAQTPVTPSQAATPQTEAAIKPGTPVSPSAAPATEPPATPKLSSPSASPQSSPQVDAKTRSTGTGPQAAPSPQTADEARVANQADQLRGIADASKDDPTYQRAYRDCMKGRGF